MLKDINKLTVAEALEMASRGLYFKIGNGKIKGLSNK